MPENAVQVRTARRRPRLRETDPPPFARNPPPPIGSIVRPGQMALTEGGGLFLRKASAFPSLWNNRLRRSVMDMGLTIVILVAVAFTAVIGWPRNRRR